MDANKTLVLVAALVFTAVFDIPARTIGMDAALNRASVVRMPLGGDKEIIAVRLSNRLGEPHVVLVGWGRFGKIEVSPDGQFLLVNGAKVALPQVRDALVVFNEQLKPHVVGNALDFKEALHELDGNRFQDSFVWKRVIAPELPPLMGPDASMPDSA